MTLEREQETGAQKLFPVSFDDFLASAEFRRIADEKLAAGEWRMDWLRLLRERTVPEFRGGMSASDYRAQLELLLEALSRPNVQNPGS